MSDTDVGKPIAATELRRGATVSRRWSMRGSRLWPWRRWIVVLGVLLAIRVALPEILRRIIVSQASQALRAQVSIGDVDLALHRGGIALKEVSVRATASADGANAAPLIAWKRFSVEVRWLPLLRKTIRLREVALESPRVDLERLADGQLNLLALLPTTSQKPPAEATPAATAAAGTGWGFGLDRVVLQDGGLRFRDLTIKDSEPVEVNLERIEITDIALRPGVYGEPSNLHLAIALDEGSLDLTARVTLRDDGMAVDASLNAQALPLRRARVYIPDVGWSALHGALDAALTHRFDTGKQNAISGTVTLRDASVEVPALEEPALGWRNLTVRVEPIDLLAHRAAVAEVTLTGASLLVRPQGGDLLPFLAAAARNTPADAGQAPDSTAPAVADGTPTDASKPWTWSVGTLHVDDSRVRLIGSAAPLDVGVTIGASDLAGDRDHLAHLELALAASQGSVNVDGQVRVQPPGFAGTVRIADLSIPELGAATGALPRDLLQAARLGSELSLEVGLAAPGGALDAHDARLRGRVSVTEPRVSIPGPQPYSIAARSVDLELKSLEAAGVLPGTPADAAAGTNGLASGDVHFQGKLSVAEASLASTDPHGLSGGVRSIELTLADLIAAGVLPAARPAAGGGPLRGDLRAGGRVALADVHFATSGPQGFALDARSIDFGIGQVSLHGLLPAADGVAAPPDLHLGDARCSLSAFKLAGADPQTFLMGTRSLELPIKTLDVPGVTAQPIRVAIGGVRLAGPTVQVTRTSDGLVLPQFSMASTSEPPVTPAPSAAVQPPRRLDVTLDALQLTGGQVSALDRTVKPFFKGGLAPLDVELRDVRWPTVAASKVRVVATGAEGTITVIGALTPNDGWFEVYGEQLALMPFNPYATAFSSYSIAGGELSVSTKGSFQSGRYDANTWLTLHNFDVRSGEGASLFQQQFGIPIEMALALMRDLKGDIALGIPIEADAQGSKVDVLAVVAGALRRAIVNALASPLKLVGAVFGGDTAKAVVPAPIGFQLGRGEIGASGTQQIDQLADFLASRPGIGVTLETSVTDSDVRWLREQALRQEWENQGVLGALRGLGQRSTRERIRRALEARAKDEAGELAAEDAAALDHWVDERPPIPAERLRALADERLAHTEAALREGHGIDAARITRRESPAETTIGAPAVRIELGSVTR